MTICNPASVTQKLLAQIEAYEQPAACHARARRKTLAVCGCAAALLCAFTAASLAELFSPTLPPAGSAAKAVLKNSGTEFAETLTCGGVRFTVEGAVWDATAVYLWLTAEAAPGAFSGFRFVMQPWDGALVSERTKAQNCGVAFLFSQAPEDETALETTELMLQFIPKKADQKKNTMNLTIRAPNGEMAHVALPLTLTAPRPQAVHTFAPTTLRVPITEGEEQGIVITKVTVQPFGAVLEGTASPEVVIALNSTMKGTVRVKPDGVQTASVAPANTDTQAITELPATVYTQYENGAVRMMMYWNATVKPESVTEIVCEDTVFSLQP